MTDVGIVDGSILKIDDFVQSYDLTVYVNHYEPETVNDPPVKIVCDEEALRTKDKNGK